MSSQLFLLLLIISFSTISLAQDVSGNLEGMVSDSLGNALPGVNITVQSENLQGLKGTATNEKGYFSIRFSSCW
ncbi:MAG: carboxypeptidase-like regulatory domain-containing protein [Ignavibacteriaceae bacterium]|nr:carboxypeptidase-like regulatory domain-containing protein [Ignavibacteriaceae bacterium]